MFDRFMPDMRKIEPRKPDEQLRFYLTCLRGLINEETLTSILTNDSDFDELNLHIEPYEEYLEALQFVLNANVTIRKLIIDNVHNISNLNALCANRLITSMNLHLCRNSDNAVLSLEAMENLLHLDVQSSEITEAGAIAISAFPKLTYLNISHNPIRFKGVTALAANQTLRTLIAQRCWIGNLGVSKFASNTCLQKLDVSNNNVINQEGIVGLSANTTLRTLLINWLKIGNQGAVALAKMKLEVLEVRSCEIGQEGMIAIAGLQLKKLDAAHNSFGNLAALALIRNTSLRELNISDSCVDATILNEIRDNTSLVALDLSRNKIGKGITSLVQNTIITHLSMESTDLDDRDIGVLAGMTQLQSLNVAANNQVFEADGLLAILKLPSITSLNIYGIPCTKMHYCQKGLYAGILANQTLFDLHGEYGLLWYQNDKEVAQTLKRNRHTTLAHQALILSQLNHMVFTELVMVHLLSYVHGITFNKTQKKCIQNGIAFFKSKRLSRETSQEISAEKTHKIT